MFTRELDVVVDSAADADLTLVVAGREVRVAPRGVAVERVAVDGADPVLTVASGGETLAVKGAVRTAPAAELRLSSPLFVDQYRRNRATGSFILIDESTNDTVGAGMVL